MADGEPRAAMRLIVLCERLGQLGGMERYLDLTLPALAAAGHEVTIVARAADVSPTYAALHVVPWSDEHDAPDWLAARRLASIARDVRPDVAVVHNVLDAAVLDAAAGAAKRFVYHVHDHRPFCPNGDRVFPRGGATCTLPMGGACSWNALTHGCAYGPRARTRELVRRRERVRDAVARADAIVAFSRYVADLAGANGVDAARLRVIAPPVADGALARTISPRPSRSAVLFLGRVVPQKGLHVLVRAIARIPAAQRPLLRVAGDGPALEDALRLARRRGIAIDALGTIAADDVPAAIDRATLVAVPSLWAEPFGLVGVESHARGRPVAAFRSGGIPEWLTSHDRGVRTGDERALTQAISALLDPQVWPAASQGVRDAADGYRLESHIGALENVYSVIS